MSEPAEDHYATLGLCRDATSNEIKTAFRELAKKCHPDMHPGNAEAEKDFKRINEAYTVLSDASERRAYNDAHAFAGHDWAKSASRSPFDGAPRRPMAARAARVVRPAADAAVAAEPLDWAEWFRAHYGLTREEQARWRAARAQAAPMDDSRGPGTRAAAHRAYEARRAAREAWGDGAAHPGGGGGGLGGGRRLRPPVETYGSFAKGYRSAEQAAGRAAPWLALAAGIAGVAIVVAVHGGDGKTV